MAESCKAQHYQLAARLYTAFEAPGAIAAPAVAKEFLQTWRVTQRQHEQALDSLARFVRQLAETMEGEPPPAVLDI